IELIREATAQGYASPLILYTSREGYAVDVEATQAGAAHYLAKGEVTPLLLERTLRYAIAQKRAEHAQRKNEAHYRSLFESIDEGFCIIKVLFDGNEKPLDYIFLDVNPAFGRQTGISNAVGRRMREIAPLHETHWFEIYGKVALTGEAVRLENRAEQLGRFYEVYAFRVGQPAERNVAVLFNDISERKQAEESLRASEDRFRQLADAMPQLVWTAGPDGTVDYYNQRYQLYGGITPEVENRWEWGPVLHPADLQPTVAAWQKAVRTGTIYQIEHRVRMAGGGYRWHISRGIPTFDDRGNLVKWYGTATDIDDYKRAQETLRQREQRLRQLFEADLIGIVTRDASGRVLEANDAYLRITGYPCDTVEAGELNIHDLTPPEYYSQDMACTQALLTSGSYKPYEKEYIRKDGTRIPVLIGYSRLEGSQTEFIGFVLDLSELKKAQNELASYAERLQASNAELEQFAFVASHDLQEPLRKIKMFGSTVQQKLKGKLDPDTEDYFQRMILASDRMQAMIEDLLELSRVSTQGRPFREV
ncbi:MAG: PAS domain S-box protein, partial [Chloroflexi bacterium]